MSPVDQSADPITLPHGLAAEPAPRAGREQLAAFVESGLHHCRRGEWQLGLYYLRKADEPDPDATLPGTYYSYLGVAIARCENDLPRAIQLCQRGVSIQSHDPDNHLNLAWARLLARDTRGAVRAIERGLAISPAHRGLRHLQARFGTRKRPVLPFLPRGHRLNVILGRLRHSMSGAAAATAG